MNAPNKPARLSLPPRTAVGDYLRVARWKTDHFVLSTRKNISTLALMLFISAFVGVFAMKWVQTPRPMDGTKAALQVLFAILLVTFWLQAMSGLVHNLGLRYTFDNEQRTIRQDYLLFRTAHIWDAADLRAVVLRITLVDEARSGSFRLKPAKSEVLELQITADEGPATKPIRLTDVETNKPRAVEVVLVARAIAKMFSLPIAVEGVPNRACLELVAALDRVRNKT